MAQLERSIESLEELSLKSKQFMEKKTKLQPKTRFRALVRLIIANLSWINEFSYQEIGDSVSANIKLFSRKKDDEKVFTKEEATILMKPPIDRTEEEKKILHKRIRGMACFQRYPDDVKKKLTAVANFMYIGPGRVVVRQGHYAHATYFILSGEITVSITKWDYLLKEWVTENVGEMEAGSMFGEMSLLFDLPRSATCTTKTECKLLYLKRDDFESILKAALQKEWDIIREAMKIFTHFDKFNEVDSRECCFLSKLNKYEPAETILGLGYGKENFVHFIVSGECQVIQHIEVIVLKDKKECRPLRLYKEGTQLKEGEFIKTFFMQVYSMRKGNCFGFGEDLENKAIVAVTSVECLLCPKHWLTKKDVNYTWYRIKHFREKWIPTREHIFKELTEQHKWLHYKEELVNNALKGKIYTHTTIHDVPFTYRLSLT